MEPIFIFSFPNHYKGKGQPDLLGTSQDGKFRIATWRKKDKYGRDMFCHKIEEVQPTTKTTHKSPAPDEPAKEQNNDDEEFLF